MKNYLVKSLYRVRDTNWYFKNRSDEQNLFDNYMMLHNISVASFEKFLQGTWELKFFTGEVDHINQAFEQTFWAVRDLWHSEPCNIFYTDPDTMAIKPVNPWNNYDKFVMFNYTDPRNLTTSNSFDASFEHFFNAGVRYFPNTMSSEIWRTAESMAQKWDHSTYDTEQIILNTMLWNQGVTVEEVLDPTMAWQGFSLNQEHGKLWNNCELTNAKIIHLHSSRGSDVRVEVMKQLCSQLDIDI